MALFYGCCSAIHCYCIFCALQDIKLAVHAHPTLSEVLDELFKSAKVSCFAYIFNSKHHTEHGCKPALDISFSMLNGKVMNNDK